MKVNLEQFKACQDYLNSVNKCPIEEIEVYEKGIKVEIPECLTVTFKVLGLNNEDYLISFLSTLLDEGKQ